MIEVYVDLDGTIAGDSDWKGYVSNTISIFRSELLFNPSKYVGKWHLLTSRPKIDLPLIHLFCFIRKLRPKSIITCNKWFWDQSCIMRKIKFLKDKSFQHKVLYIDSDPFILSLIEPNKRLKRIKPEQFKMVMEQIDTRIGEIE